MKKNILFLIALFLISFFASAQKLTPKKPREEKIKALKIAFITDELNLTSKEAQRFWPVYNKFNETLHQLERVEKQHMRSNIKGAGGIENISEKEAKELMKKIADLEKQIYNTKIAYDSELAKVLSYKKILKLKTAEREFIRNLMKKYRRRVPKKKA
jgi:Spy/CpxP family protein refolding chaperone